MAEGSTNWNASLRALAGWDWAGLTPAVRPPPVVSPPAPVVPPLAHGVPALPAAAEGTVPEEWQVGNVIQDLYEVKPIKDGAGKHYAEGGMGRVYRVRHRGWDMDLAAKVPLAESFQNEIQKENFVHECEVWVNLGLHPHTVSCYYVRTLGNVPVVFAEFVEGGNLKEWIDSKKLYEGGPEAGLKRILDIAIQFAWGLHYAHEREVIHQDVKPTNVMLTAEGGAKVTDFGLARARAVTGATMTGGGGRSVLASYGGMTAAYCSPEQAQIKALLEANAHPALIPKLTRRTDIWSWGVSVLEMFMGGVTWRQGNVADAVLDSYFEGEEERDPDLPRMTTGLAELLNRCLQRNPGDRFKDMREVAGELIALYREYTGEDYGHSEPRAAELRADGRNNQALSLLDLGKGKEAENLFEQAIQAEPSHPEATYNRGLVLWRSGRMTDDVLVRQLEAVKHQREENWCAGWLLGQVHLERGDVEMAIKELEGALPRSEDNQQVRAALVKATTLSHGRWARCLRTFEGHPDFIGIPDREGNSPESRFGLVYSVVISPNGRWGLSGSMNREMRLWDLATGTCLRTFYGHGDTVRSVAISPDGRWGLSGCFHDDKTLRLWDLGTGQCVRTFEGHQGKVFFVKDGRLALSGGESDTPPKLWDLSTGTCLRSFDGFNGVLAISPNGRLGISEGSENTMRLWDLSNGSTLQIFRGHTGRVHSFAISRDGCRGLSAGNDKTFRLWDLSTGKCPRTFAGHTEWVTSVAISPDGSRGLSASKDTTIRLWDLSTGICLRTFEGHRDEARSVAISPDGRWGLSGSSDRTLRLWDLAVGPSGSYALTRPRTHTELTRNADAYAKKLDDARAALSAGDSAKACDLANEARSIRGYSRARAPLDLRAQAGVSGTRRSLLTGWCSRIFEGHTNAVCSVAISPDGRWGLSGSWDESLRLWDMAVGTCLRTFMGQGGGVHSVAISPDSRLGLSVSRHGSRRLWDLGTGACLQTFEGGWMSSFASFSPDGRWAITGLLELCDPTTGACRKCTFETHDVFYDRFLAISPDGRLGLSTDWNEPLRLWELSTGICLRNLQGHRHVVTSAAISPDGRWGLSGSHDKSVRLWDLDTGACLRTFEGHTDLVSSVAFFPDGRWGLSASEDNTLRLWDLMTGACIRVFRGHLKGITSVAISPDGRWGLSGSKDNTLRLWEFVWDYAFPPLAHWDEGVRPYLQNFITLHKPYASDMQTTGRSNNELVRLALTRSGIPTWTESEFLGQIVTLRQAGYGWLEPEGIRRELEKLNEVEKQREREFKEAMLGKAEAARRKAEVEQLRKQQEEASRRAQDEAWNRTLRGRIARLFGRKR